MENHHGSDCKEYHVQEEAYDAYRQAHDRLVDMKSATSNENLQGIYAKARDYVARLAMILHALEHAVAKVADGEPHDGTTEWSISITASAVEAASAIMEHLNLQKKTLMGLETGIVCNLNLVWPV